MTKVTIENEFGTYSVELKNNDCDLGEMCQLFSQVLRGAGYYFDGEVTIEKEEAGE
jgi:hypothetical protein